MKKMYTLGIALVVLLSMILSASALESKTMSRENSITAMARWTSPDGSIYTDLIVTETKDGTDIYVYPTDSKTNGVIMKGHFFTQEDVFDVKNKLTAATLSPVKVDLADADTGQTVKTITIQAQWTGVGDLEEHRDKSMSKNGESVEKFSDYFIRRYATATGSIETDAGTIIDLGTSDLGKPTQLSEEKSASKTIEK